MNHPGRTRWALVGGSFGVIATLAAVVALGVLAGSGAASEGASPPVNTSAPTIHGTAAQGQVLTADPGTWTGTQPISFTYHWQRCDKNGAHCMFINDFGRHHTVTSADVGNTVRVVVTGKNSAGSSDAASAPSPVVASAGTAPVNSSTPTISGTAQVGQILTAAPGTWTGTLPISFTYHWQRCDRNGANCAYINDFGRHHTVVAPDVGNTDRVVVTARNSAGSTNAFSTVSAVVAAKAAGGCANGAAGTVAVASVDAPARLTIDRLQFVPGVLSPGSHVLTARFHVSACNGNSVQGALVYATGVPYHQLNNAPEVATDSAGWATIGFHMLSGYPAARHQRLLVIFVRARKPGENPLGGVSIRRLVSVPIR